jgi:hypothetical protein
MAAVDYFRRPTKSYTTVQRSFQMVLASLEYDRDTLRVRDDVNWPLWVINDHWYAIAGARVRWQVIDPRGAAVSGGDTFSNLAADSSSKLTDVHWLPVVEGKYEIHTEVVGARGERLSENVYEFNVKGR